ncbi:MAG: GNAT family N-acetyltransferase [Candidatus Thorarchaeota archaeon]|nr:GNAT family N-acetyltransferase [Candidatus Thorarchaeota archaeon]
MKTEKSMKFDDELLHMEVWREKLRDGREVVVRFLTHNDKKLLLDMVNGFSDHVILWGSPPYDEAKIDRWMNGADRGLSLVAVYNQKFVGISASYTNLLPRGKGIGGMMIYLHQEFHGVGLGTIMMMKLLDLAKDKGLHRISLEVVEDNKAAVRLYEKFGFKVEGKLVDAYYGIDEKYHNMLVMGKIL